MKPDKHGWNKAVGRVAPRAPLSANERVRVCHERRARSDAPYQFETICVHPVLSAVKNPVLY